MTMDCLEALEWLEAREHGLGDDCAPQVQLAERHLAECAQCRTARPQLQQWNVSLSRAMSQVEIPADLRSRLQAKLAPEVMAAPTVSGKTKAVSRRRWVISAVSVAAACLLTMASLSWWSAPPPLTLADLYAGVDTVYAELPVFRSKFEPRLPSSWTSIYTLEPSLIRGFPSAGPQAGRVALIPFQMSSRSGREPLRGRLLMLSRQQLTDEAGRSLSEDFSQAEVRYLPEGRGAYVVWSEDNLVYVCLMPSGPADLHRFQRALSASRSLT